MKCETCEREVMVSPCWKCRQRHLSEQYRMEMAVVVDRDAIPERIIKPRYHKPTVKTKDGMSMYIFPHRFCGLRDTGLTRRETVAIMLRNSGLTYKAVGEAMGIGPQRARQLSSKLGKMVPVPSSELEKKSLCSFVAEKQKLMKKYGIEDPPMGEEGEP